jgi:hypothetical protein
MASTRHPQRKEIARYLLSRGLDQMGDSTSASAFMEMPESFPGTIPFPAGLAPEPAATPPTRQSGDPLPKADVIAITWTLDEQAALAHALTPGVSPVVQASSQAAHRHWLPYDRNFATTFEPDIRPGAPSRHEQRLASFYPLTIGTKSVLAMKSELHLNQDGVSTGTGTATLPVKDFFKQIIEDSGAALVITTGTAGSVHPPFGLGDVVVTRAARFMCKEEFRNEPFNNTTYKSDWKVPTKHFPDAQALMSKFSGELSEPPVGPPSPQYQAGTLTPPPVPDPKIRVDGTPDLAAFHPILTTDYFEYGTTTNGLDQLGSAVEMGDAALGLACTELTHPPRWLVVRNMSDPVINGALPAKEYHLNEQTTWAVGYYTAYGRYTSFMSALTCWAVIAGL